MSVCFRDKVMNFLGLDICIESILLGERSKVFSSWWNWCSWLSTASGQSFCANWLTSYRAVLVSAGDGWSSIFLSHVGGMRFSMFSLEDMNLLWTSVWVSHLHQTLNNSLSVWSVTSWSSCSLAILWHVVVNWLLSRYVRVVETVDVTSSDLHAL